MTVQVHPDGFGKKLGKTTGERQEVQKGSRRKAEISQKFLTGSITAFLLLSLV